MNPIHAELFEELWTKAFDVEPGQAGENVTTQGIDLLGLPAGSASASARRRSSRSWVCIISLLSWTAFSQD